MRLIYLAPAALALAACATPPNATNHVASNDVTCRYLVDSSVGGRNSSRCLTSNEWAVVDKEARDRRDKLGLFVSSAARGSY